MNNKMTKVAVAAVIIVAVLIGINQFGGSIDGTSVAWGKVEEAMKELPYLHIVNKSSAEGEESISQCWFNFDEQKSFRAEPGGYLWGLDHNKEKEYFYNPDTKKLTISHMHKDEVAKGTSAYSLIDMLIDKMQEIGATVAYQKTKLNDKDVLIAEISKTYPDKNMFFGSTAIKQQNFKLIVNQKTNLIIAGKMDMLDVNGVVICHVELKMDYPQKGPKDIYDIGVPKDTEIINNTLAPNK